MNIKAQLKGGVCRLQMEGELTIYHAQAIRHELIEQLATCKEIELNLSGVSEMDSAGFQLLLATKREGSRLGKLVSFVSHSQAALELIDLYNMAAQFGDPLLIPAQH
jgi:anti-anti-sigma factor